MQLTIRMEGRSMEVTYVPSLTEMKVLVDLHTKNLFIFAGDNQDYIRYRKAIKELLEHGFMKYVGNESIDAEYQLTEKGKAFAEHFSQERSQTIVHHPCCEIEQP